MIQEMNTAFENTTRSLSGDNGRQVWLMTLFALLVLSAWVAWSFLFPIPIHKSALSGRLEKTANPVSIVAHRDGYVKQHQIDVGREVSRQDILLRFDDGQELQKDRRIQLEIKKLAQQKTWLEREIESFEKGGEENIRLLKLQHEKTIQALLHASEQSDLIQQIVSRMEESGVESQLDLLTHRLRSREHAAKVEDLKFDLRQYTTKQRQYQQVQAAGLARLNKQLAQLEGEAAEALQDAAAQKQILSDLDIIAPVDGQVAEAIAITPGEWIARGTPLGTILPAGDWQYIAYFAPSEVYGHIRAGQVADIHLDGFPWQQYGSLKGQVTRVDSERRGHQVRVILQLIGQGPDIPLQHGMPGTVHIQTETATPWQLLLRAVSASVNS